MEPRPARRPALYRERLANGGTLPKGRLAYKRRERGESWAGHRPQGRLCGSPLGAGDGPALRRARRGALAGAAERRAERELGARGHCGTGAGSNRESG